MIEEELDQTIRGAQRQITRLQSKIEAIQREIAQTRQIEGDALRLFQSLTGEVHPCQPSRTGPRRRSPRADRVLAVLQTAGIPMTLDELIQAMPDDPNSGAISAVVHRAIKKGQARRLEPGVYEATRGYAEAS